MTSISSDYLKKCRLLLDPAHNILSDNNSPTSPDNRLKTYNGTTYYYDYFGNLIHRELTDDEVQNYFYDLHDQLVKAEIFKKAANNPTTSTATKSVYRTR